MERIRRGAGRGERESKKQARGRERENAGEHWVLPAGFPCERGLNDNGAHQGPSTTQSHGSARNTGTHSMLLYLHTGMLHRMHTRYINIDLIVCLIYCI